MFIHEDAVQGGAHRQSAEKFNASPAVVFGTDHGEAFQESVRRIMSENQQFFQTPSTKSLGSRMNIVEINSRIIGLEKASFEEGVW